MRSLLRIALAVAVSGLALGAETTPERSEWTALTRGMWYRDWAPARAADGRPIPGHAFRIDPKVLRVTVLDARTDGGAGQHVEALRSRSGARLVVNASFFDPENRPLGLVIADGETRNRLRKLDQGIFLITEGQPRIQHSRSPLPDSVEMAVQSFPRLIVDGAPLRLKERASRRTTLCVPGDGTMVIVVIPSAISLPDLAANLSRHVDQGGLGCWSALNLDGGPSTQLSLSSPVMNLEVPGGWPVPNALAVFER